MKLTQLIAHALRRKPIDPPRPGRVAVPRAEDSVRDYPGAGLTPSRLTAILREADDGSLGTAMQLFEELEEKDAHLFSVANVRRLALTGLDWQLVSAADVREGVDRTSAEFPEPLITTEQRDLACPAGLLWVFDAALQQNDRHGTLEVLAKSWLAGQLVGQLGAEETLDQEHLVDASQTLERQTPQGSFGLVSLLIGVNNQFRGRDADEYRKQFVRLLDMAITFAEDDRKRVLVLSIPDYGVTPFGQRQEPKRISAEIDEFNRINRDESQRAGIMYVDVTALSRRASTDTETNAVSPKPKLRNGCAGPRQSRSNGERTSQTVSSAARSSERVSHRSTGTPLSGQ